MFELLIVILAFCLLMLGFKLLLAAVGAVLWLVTFPLRVLGWILLLPLQILGWGLGLLLAVIALPFVFLGLAAAMVGLVVAAGLAGALVFLPLLVLVLPVALLVWMLRRGGAHSAAS